MVLRRGNGESGERPPERVLGLSVPVCHEGRNRRTELLKAPEVSVAQASPLQDPEPEFDLVNPRGVNECVVKAKTILMTRIEPLPALSLVNTQIVPHHMDDPGNPLGHLFHERFQIVPGPRVPASSQHVSVMNQERRDQRLSAVADVLEFPSARFPRAGGAIRMFALRGLHPRLLVHADHRLARGRIQIQLDDLGHLRAEVGIGAVQPQSVLVGLQVGPLEDRVQMGPADSDDVALLDDFLQQVQGLAMQPVLSLRARFARDGDDLAALGD